MKKLFVVIICLFSVWVVMTACDDTSDPDSYTLSGDITAQFETLPPSDTVTIELMSESDCGSTPLFSDSTDTWISARVSIGYALFQSSYEISGIEAGTYYLCGSTDEIDIANYVPYGPAEINISDDTVHDFQLY